MTDKIFIDTNILGYLFNNSDEPKKIRAKEIFQELLTKTNYKISSQVINELCNVMMKKVIPPVEHDKMVQILSVIPDHAVVETTKDDAIRALDLNAKYHFSFWDSLIIAAAEKASCSIIYSEDFSHDQKIETVKIINPFKI